VAKKLCPNPGCNAVLDADAASCACGYTWGRAPHAGDGAPNAKPSQHWVKGTLWTLLALFAVAAVCVGWNYQASRSEVADVQALFQESGGRALFVKERPFTVTDQTLALYGKGGIVICGVERRWGVQRVVMLSLRDLYVTNAGLAHLTGLTQLQDLDLLNTRVADAKTVHQDRIEIGDDAFPQIGDGELVYLQGLTQLRTLRFDSDRMTDSGLAFLTGLTHLQSLNLLGADITDAGLFHLEGLTGLRSLILSGDKITDAGLIHLERMTELQSLTLLGTNVTERGEKEMREAIPNCEIKEK
jgi:hypothetical protein